MAKMRILQNQTAEDAFIYWGEDEFVSRYVMSTSHADADALLPDLSAGRLCC